MRRLYLDPGHGGADNGAVANGLTEKDWVLSFCQGLYWMVHGLPGVGVRVSRWSDEDLTLGFPAQQAAEMAPDMAVCVHLNAFSRPTVRGSRVFWMDDLQESPEEYAVALARNMPPQLPARVGYPDREHYPRVRNVLRPYMDRGVPAVLLECGFVTNPGDADALKRPETRLAIAHAIIKALRMAG